MTKNDDKRVPALRFKGFNDDWAQRMLGKIAVIIMGQSPDGSTYSKVPSTYILVQGNADIKNGWVKPRLWSSQSTKEAQKGDIILTVRAPVGEVAKTNYDVVLGRGVAGIRGNDFIFHLLTLMNINNYWNKFSTGSTFESINSNDIKKAIVNIPPQLEQGKIGKLLNTLNNLIALQQRKLEQLKSIKKAMLQKLFVNKDMPILHFKGFNNIWKRSKLGNITKTISSKPYISGAYEEGKYEVVQQGDHPIAGYSNDIPFKNYKDVTLFGDHTLSLFKPRKAFLIASDGIKILSPSVTMDSLFYYYLLEKYKPRSEGYKRHFSILKKSVALFPVSINEQTQIAHVLIIIDKTISLQQERIEKLRNYKRFLLQNMLI